MIMTISSSSSSWCHAACTDLPDPSSLPISIVYRFRGVFLATSCIGTELLYIGSSWSSHLCMSMWMGPKEYIAYDFVLTSQGVRAELALYSPSTPCQICLYIMDQGFRILGFGQTKPCLIIEVLPTRSWKCRTTQDCESWTRLILSMWSLPDLSLYHEARLQNLRF